MQLDFDHAKSNHLNMREFFLQLRESKLHNHQTIRPMRSQEMKMMDNSSNGYQKQENYG